MNEHSHDEAGVGYWHDMPISVGRLIEDGLALAWRVRRRIAPIVLLLTMGSAIISQLTGGWLEKVTPQLNAPTTTALRMPIVFPTDLLLSTLAWDFFSLMLVVALTKALYASYVDHDDSFPVRVNGLTLGVLRLFGAMFCYFIGVIVLLLPLFFLLILDMGLVSIASKSVDVLVFGLAILTLVVTLGGISAFALTLIAGQYVVTASVVTTDSILRILRDGFSNVLAIHRLRRSLTIGYLVLGIMVILDVIALLLGHVISLLSRHDNAIVVSDVFGSLIVTPILTAFGVVYFTDARKRLALDRAPVALDAT